MISQRMLLKPVVALLFSLVLVLVFVPQLAAQTDTEGFDLMRQITSQWVKPNIMLTLDRSGSMAWPVENGSTNMPVQCGEDIVYPHVNYDYTKLNAYGPFYRGTTNFPNNGTGHGYWLKVDRTINPAQLKTVSVGSSERGRTYQNDRNWIYFPDGDPGYDYGDLLMISNFSGYPEVTGMYMVINDQGNSIQVARMKADGTRDPSRYRFPVVNTFMDFQRVRIGPVNANNMEAREPIAAGYFNRNYADFLYVDGNPLWAIGDIIRVSNMSNAADNGIYMIQSTPGESSTRPGSLRFRVSALDANGTWDDEDSNHTMTSNQSRAINIQRVMPASLPLAGGPFWYFIPPSRMAITKNVLGKHIWIYNPQKDLVAAGVDSAGTDYYTFAAGTDPSSGTGAYYDWYYKAWVGWTGGGRTPTNEPVPDAVFSDAMEPADLVDVFGDVVNWGLVAYSGDCDNPTILVEVNPDDNDQLASIAAIELHLDTVADGGLNPSGSTPTRGALETAREGLLTGWTANSVVYDSAWDNDARRGCNRTYATILMTDGESNQCNPSNNSWSSCPNTWDSYPAGRTNDLWNGLDDGGTFLTNVRTWVIGVSEFVGRCELNYTAYKGRTDASSPNNDAGFKTADDPRLPEGSPGTYDSSADYAYFANSAEELYAALISIVTSMGVGDYSTGAPSVSSQSVAGSIAFLGSTEYPTWEGHLRAFNIGVDPALPGFLRWDAADVLTNTAHPNNDFPRRVYTWNPGSSNELVAITSTNFAAIDSICGGCGFDVEVADFVLGNDGTGNPRNMLLGPIFNSTPTVIGPPRPAEQSTTHEHSSFQSKHSGRRSLVWIGTSDGMARAFDVDDGAEILCLIPPNLLDNQARLYNTFVKSLGDSPLGQPQLPSQHIWGVSNSIRFTDVYFPDDATYKTVLFITEGPGGSGVHAVDVSHAFPGRTINTVDLPADAEYGFGNGASGDPVEVLWSKTGDGEAGTDIIAGLGNSWSVPALGAIDFEEWRLQIGNGFSDNPGNTTSPKTYFLDPATGDPSPGNFAQSSPSMTNSASYWVSNQTFADAVYWQDSAERFQQDNLVNEAVQADLNGHLWRIVKQGNSMSISSLVTTSDPEPFYYSPAVSSYPMLERELAIYAFSSGSYYEVNTNITGNAVGAFGNFIPKIHLAVRTRATNAVAHVAIPIDSIELPAGGGLTLGPRAQATTSPMLFIPKTGSTLLPFALYLIYDPDATACIGYSYIVKIEFDPEDLSNWSSTAYFAGEGTSGGFAVADDHVIVGQSGVGQDTENGEIEIAQATIIQVPDIELNIGGGDENVNWWVELQ